ncbi:MAG: S41 family peptidase [Saprospiraceae bacterium]
MPNKLILAKRHITLLIISLFCLCTTELSAQSEELLSRSEMEEDLNNLEEKLLKIHPALDFYESSRELPEIIAAVRASLPESLSSIDFLLHIAPIIDATKCGHTGFNINSKRKFFGLVQKDVSGLFPLQLKIVEGLSFISKNLSVDTINVSDKMQLLRINGERTDEVLFKLANLNLGSDGANRLGEINFSRKYFMLAYHMFYGAQDSFNLELKNLYNNTITKVSVPAGSLKSMRKIRLARYPSLKMAPIQLRRIEGMPKVAVLDVNTFTNVKFDLWQLGYLRMMKKIFKIVEKENIDYLIMDLRGNPGGVVANVTRLMKYTYDQSFVMYDRVSINRTFFKSDVGFFQKLGLFFRRKQKTQEAYILKRESGKKYKPKKRHRFDGMMVVLIDEGSFSAACTYALQAKSRNRAVLIGGEAGGSYHIVSAGDSHNCKMKNSELSIRIPLLKIDYQVDPDLQSILNGVVPDIIKHQKIADFMNGKDSQLEAAVEMVKKHLLQSPSNN